MERKKILEKKSHNAEKLKGGTLWGFSTSNLSQNIKKLKWKKILFSEKNSHSAEKKLKGGTLWDFPTSILSQNSKKMKGGPFGEKNFRKKVWQCRKKLKGGTLGDPLVSPGMVSYAGKQETPFWFSSLDQIVQFGAIIFCRTILVSSCGLKKKEKPLY